MQQSLGAMLGFPAAEEMVVVGAVMGLLVAEAMGGKSCTGLTGDKGSGERGRDCS